MPKKMGINSKAVEAKARKDEVKKATTDRVEREKEDASWKDDDKHVQKKQSRKEDKEKKMKELAERKAANKSAYEEEMGSSGAEKREPAKTTRAQISASVEKQKEELEKRRALEEKAKSKILVAEEVVEENLNRLHIDGQDARTVDEALVVLGSKDDIDKHPERRMKAAYATFEEENLPKLKAENPNLRLSQLKQMLKKDWIKSPDNPLNKALASMTR
ncbi:Coiled-coil domain-containing protein [Halotydeus destructor]|nr:Coiled-coil domain-containing protein [Halotydeus destructor]